MLSIGIAADTVRDREEDEDPASGGLLVDWGRRMRFEGSGKAISKRTLLLVTGRCFLPNDGHLGGGRGPPAPGSPSLALLLEPSTSLPPSCKSPPWFYVG